MKASCYLNNNEEGEFVNYNLIVMIIFLQEYDYDLFFKMMGGQNSSSYLTLKAIKHLNEIVNESNMKDYLVSINSRGGITSDNHYKVAVAINKGLNITTIQDPNTDISIKYGEDWLLKTFTKKEIVKIKSTLEKLRDNLN